MHLCAAPQYQAETLKCFFHLNTREWTLDFSIKVTQECKQPSIYFLSWLSPHLWDAPSLSWWPRWRYSRWKPEKTFQHRCVQEQTPEKSPAQCHNCGDRESVSEPLLRIRWPLLTFRFSSPKSQTYSWGSQNHSKAVSRMASLALVWPGATYLHYPYYSNILMPNLGIGLIYFCFLQS